MTVQRTLEQKRLEYAIKVVGEAKAKADPKFDFEKYAGRCASLPAQVMQSGLHQALLFCKAKGEPDYTELYQQISKWLIDIEGVLKPADKQGQDVLALLAQHSMEIYMQATRETLALLVHIRRIAKASKGEK